MAASLVEVSKNLFVNFQHFFADILLIILIEIKYLLLSLIMSSNHIINLSNPCLGVIIFKNLKRILFFAFAACNLEFVLIFK